MQVQSNSNVAAGVAVLRRTTQGQAFKPQGGSGGAASVVKGGAEAATNNLGQRVDIRA